MATMIKMAGFALSIFLTVVIASTAQAHSSLWGKSDRQRLGFTAEPASREDITAAYRSLAKSYHPNAYPTATETRKAELAADFLLIQQSYHRLLARYDAKQVSPTANETSTTQTETSQSPNESRSSSGASDAASVTNLGLLTQDQYENGGYQRRESYPRDYETYVAVSLLHSLVKLQSEPGRTRYTDVESTSYAALKWAQLARELFRHSNISELAILDWAARHVREAGPTRDFYRAGMNEFLWRTLIAAIAQVPRDHQNVLRSKTKSAGDATWLVLDVEPSSAFAVLNEYLLTRPFASFNGAHAYGQQQSWTPFPATEELRVALMVATRPPSKTRAIFTCEGLFRR